ncbi:unnamed protein product, partial [Iphiclides podalirius]
MEWRRREVYPHATPLSSHEFGPCLFEAQIKAHAFLLALITAAPSHPHCLPRPSGCQAALRHRCKFN